ncbi:MAG: SUMF1/EgtB/PvdO family nonheme iron enzyme [Anaerolineae bacterium]
MDAPRTLWTDHPIQTRNEDRLNFADYADILADIILTADTPITLGIFGPWGSGKTSLMRLIAERLIGQRTTGHRRARTVWFNAWQYERDEAALWRALLLHVLDGLRSDDLSEEDARQIEDWRMRLYADVERTELGSLQVDWPAAGRAALKLGLSFIPGPGTLAELVKLAQGNLSVVEDLVKAFRRERVEIYRRRLTFLEEFQAGFAHLVREYIWSRNGLLVLFIDDLDRCLPARAVEVLETVKLYLDVPGCAFVIAADREVIERVVQSQYGAETDAPFQGRDYLDKLVQIPFYLPPLEEEQILSYIADHAPEVDSTCRTIFAAGLEPNPRVVKRALNIFRLLADLARRREQAGVMEPVVPALLAKMVVIQTRYRDLYRDLQEYPVLIQDLETAAREGAEVRHPVTPVPTEANTLLEKYLRHRPLLRMLRLGPPFAALSREQIAAYIFLVRTTGAESAELPADLPARRWADLVSNDPIRLRSAVETIRAQGTAEWYGDALVRLMESGSGAPVSERLSAATALGYLGDPRNLDEMVEVPGGSFLFGEERRPVMTMTFRIGRYPVTNAQYARFLQANPWYPVPYVDEEWARPYNWDPVTRTYPEGKANHPVVLVSWEDAQAYCAWAGVRLPTEEEWERAARGEDGRAYPWGASFDPTRANVRESGIGSTTPVGIYPEGASPYGLLDCAGNVWEWTSTPYDDEEFIIRGGAWNFFAEDARTFIRERARRDHRSHCVGFRVAAGPAAIRPDDAAREGAT